jgi:hypothetical protein
MIVLQAGMAAGQHWRHLDAHERTRLKHLVLLSKGRPGNLSPKERAEVKRIAAKLDLPGLARVVAPIAGRGRRRRP